VIEPVSLLYVPGLDEAVLRKAPGRGADVVIVDLEDSVLPEAKDAARARVERVWPELAGSAGSELWLRVNGAGTPWHAADLEAAARIGPATVVVPKGEDPGQLPGIDLPVAVMVETARGVGAAAEIARAEGLRALIFGAADFRRSVGATPLPEEAELLVARSLLVLAARAAGIGVFDTPWFDLRDAAGLDASARRARALGFDGKCCIHPGQVAVVHGAFAPSAAEVARAEAVVAALAVAAAAGRGVAVVDGEMVEPLHGAEAERTLRRRR
jgi:citrate lyase subunit beta/citryl-CoA lyase